MTHPWRTRCRPHRSAEPLQHNATRRLARPYSRANPPMPLCDHSRAEVVAAMCRGSPTFPHRATHTPNAIDSMTSRRSAYLPLGMFFRWGPEPFRAFPAPAINQSTGNPTRNSGSLPRPQADERNPNRLRGRTRRARLGPERKSRAREPSVVSFHSRPRLGALVENRTKHLLPTGCMFDALTMQHILI